MDDAFEKIRALAKDADGTQRMEILDSLRGLTRSLEAAPDTMQRLSYMVTIFWFQCIVLFHGSQFPD